MAYTVTCRPHPVLAEVFGGLDPAPLVGAVLAKSAAVGETLQKAGASSSSLLEFPMDHICWRCHTEGEYLEVQESLRRFPNARLLLESMIGGRPIATWQLLREQPLCFDIIMEEGWSGQGRAGGGKDEPEGGRKLELAQKEVSTLVLEITAPKRGGTQYASGWEHVEFAIGEENYAKLAEFLVRGGEEGRGQNEIPWSLDAAGKATNPDVSAAVEVVVSGNGGSGGENASASGNATLTRKGSFKVHADCLASVIATEIAHGDVVPVPKDYFH